MRGMCNSEKVVYLATIFPLENIKKRDNVGISAGIGNRGRTIIDTPFQPFTQKPNSSIESVL